MKKSLIYILIGTTVAAIAALVIVEIRRRKQAVTVAALQSEAAVNNSIALQKFKGFNFDILLGASTKRAVPEITALQHMINGYFNGTKVIGVNGVFDSATQAAVKEITGKTSTSLHEFMFEYLIKERGEKVANDIITSITQTGK